MAATLVAGAAVEHGYLAHGYLAHGHLARAHPVRADDALPPLTWHTALTQWQFDALVTAGVAVVAVVYLLGVWRVRRAHRSRPWPIASTASFLCGLAVLVFATQGSVGAYDDVLFYMHMWQHLLLIMVAPPLLLAGRPITLLLHASKNPLHTWVKRAVRSKVASGVTFPLVGVALYIVVVVATHLTSFMNVTLTNQGMHYAEHGLYLVAGYLYFLPLVGREPIRWRLSYPAQLLLLVLAMPVDTFTGVVLMQTNYPMFPAYVGRREWGPSVVDDLHAGGAVMWIAGDAIMFVLIIVLFAAVARKSAQFDAGRWLEGVRARRLRELSPSAAAITATAAGREMHGPDGDAQLAAYNEYLARLNGEHGSPAGSPH